MAAYGQPSNLRQRVCRAIGNIVQEADEPLRNTIRARAHVT